MLIQPRAEPPQTLPAHDRVYRTLRTRIMHGELAPGQSLTLRGIGAEYGVSMTPAREAVRRLAAEGALSLSPSLSVTVRLNTSSVPSINSGATKVAEAPWDGKWKICTVCANRSS